MMLRRRIITLEAAGHRFCNFFAGVLQNEDPLCPNHSTPPPIPTLHPLIVSQSDSINKILYCTNVLTFNSGPPEQGWQKRCLFPSKVFWKCVVFFEKFFKCFFFWKYKRDWVTCSFDTLPWSRSGIRCRWNH